MIDRGKDHITLRCYESEQGAVIGSWIEENIAPYREWCEKMVLEWKAKTDALGYTWPCWCIGSVGTGTQTYHEWLKERCRL